MSGPIGHTFIYNIVILFLLIVFAFLAGTLSYYKAFNVNNRIVDAVEKYEGYNNFSKDEIDKKLSTIGYSLEKINCPEQYKDMYLISLGENYRYCIYINSDNPRNGEYYRYGILTYMNLDLPIVSRINLPVFTKTNQIYKFSS